MRISFFSTSKMIGHVRVTLAAALVMILSVVLTACSSGPSSVQAGRVVAAIANAATSAPRAQQPAPEQPELKQAEPATQPATDKSGGIRTVQSEYPWDVTVESANGRVGEQFSITLPPGGDYRTVWGTYFYTGDSSIGSAAVHAGLITFAQGGTVTVEVLDGMDYYIGSQMNGVSTSYYGGWGSSFTFIQNGRRVFAQPYNVIAWDISADLFPEDATVTVRLPPGGFSATVWGTDVYTSDSSIGTAAVHAGLITFNDGGEVTIRRVPGQKSYRGSQRNGVSTSDYGEWGGSFEFIR